MTTLGEAAFILKRLADAYSSPVSDEKVRAYHSVLQRYPRMVLVTAVSRLMESSKFFPRISEILEVAKQVMTAYTEPDWAKFDEATLWYLYTHSMTSPDELTEEDVQRIRKDAGMAQDPPRTFSQAEVREMCKVRGLPVSMRAERRQAEPVA